MMNVAKQVLAILMSYAIVLAQGVALQAQSRNFLRNSASASRLGRLGSTTVDASAAFPKQNSELSDTESPNSLISLASPSVASSYAASPNSEQQSETATVLTVSLSSLKFSKQIGRASCRERV